jgi:hypothetical protein
MFLRAFVVMAILVGIDATCRQRCHPIKCLGRGDQSKALFLRDVDVDCVMHDDHLEPAGWYGDPVPCPGCNAKQKETICFRHCFSTALGGVGGPVNIKRNVQADVFFDRNGHSSGKAIRGSQPLRIDVGQIRKIKGHDCVIARNVQLVDHRGMTNGLWIPITFLDNSNLILTRQKKWKCALQDWRAQKTDYSSPSSQKTICDVNPTNLPAGWNDYMIKPSGGDPAPASYYFRHQTGPTEGSVNLALNVPAMSRGRLGSPVDLLPKGAKFIAINKFTITSPLYRQDGQQVPNKLIWRYGYSPDDSGQLSWGWINTLQLSKCSKPPAKPAKPLNDPYKCA